MIYNYRLMLILLAVPSVLLGALLLRFFPGHPRAVAAAMLVVPIGYITLTYRHRHRR